LTYDIAASLPFNLAILGILVSLAIALATVTIRGARAVLLGPLMILSSITIIALTTELTLRLGPFVQPAALRNFIAAEDLQHQQALMVQYLDQSPWATFRPNTRIRSQGYRGTPEQFSYEWVTDKFGFKNTEALADQTPIDVIALGDSFTEGMGVPEGSTWPAHLTKLGLSTYNLGVQGYSPSQLAGVLDMYGLQRKPRWVVVGYTTSTFQRESLFADRQNSQQSSRLAGGIQSIANADVRGEIRDQSRVMLSALYLLARDLWMEFRHGSISPAERWGTSFLNTSFDPYAPEILALGDKHDLMEAIEDNQSTWTSTLGAFEQIIEKSQAIGASVVLVYLPDRSEIYYTAATGLPLPNRYLGKLEANRLNDFAAEYGVRFVNPSDQLREHVTSLLPELNDGTRSKLPFLEFDGHPSSVGYELIAGEIAQAIRDEQSATGLSLR